jgi:hypothetical protein
MKFSTYINGQVRGPYSIEELKSLGLKRTAKVSKEGTSNESWPEAQDFEELAELWKKPIAKKIKQSREVSKPIQETPPEIEPVKKPTLTTEIEEKRKQKKAANADTFKKTVIGVLALIALFFLFDKFPKGEIQPVNTVTGGTNDATSITEELGSENSQKMYEELITEGVDAYGSDKLGLAFEKFSAASIIRTENKIEVSKKAQKAYKDIVSKNKENAKSDLKVLRDVALQSFLIAQQIENTEEVRKELKKLN